MSQVDIIFGSEYCLSSGPMNPTDEAKTAFSTHGDGLYQYEMMPLGLCTAGASFQSITVGYLFTDPKFL